MTNPSSAAAIAAMRAHWRELPECSVYSAVGLDCLAVPLRLACELWGYGREAVPALALPDPAQLVPIAGWQLEDARGYMAFEGLGDVDARRLVLLKDLVRWRMQSKRCPLRAAVNDVIDGLSATWAAQWLYQVKPGDYARLMRADDCFSGARSFWEQFAKDDSAASCGLLGLLYAMREHWGADGLPNADEVQRKGLQGLESAAIRMDVAHALWGWGTVVAPAAAVLTLVQAPSPVPAVPVPVGKVPHKSQAPEWTGKRLAEKRAALKRETPAARDLTQQLSQITGLPAREITRRERAYRNEAQQPGGCATGSAA